MIINQDENGSDFFIIIEGIDNKQIFVSCSFNQSSFLICLGTAIVYQKPTEDGPSVEVSRLGPKEYFGAKSLFFNQPHGASVKAHGPLTCARMAQGAFENKVTPVLVLLRQRAEQYMSFLHLSV